MKQSWYINSTSGPDVFMYSRKYLAFGSVIVVELQSGGRSVVDLTQLGLKALLAYLCSIPAPA